MFNKILEIMKKLIAFFATFLLLATFTANAGCYWNSVSQICCENGEMYCAPEPGVNCDGTPEQ